MVGIFGKEQKIEFPAVLGKFIDKEGNLVQVKRGKGERISIERNNKKETFENIDKAFEVIKKIKKDIRVPESIADKRAKEILKERAKRIRRR